MQNAQLSIMRNQANLYTVSKKTKDLEVTTTEEVEVRTMKKPEKFDEKGKVVKTFSKEEKKELGWDAKNAPIRPSSPTSSPT